ncbi:MAG: outer membrane protein assembly factor BamA, partial [Desulfobulbaceae bacterium]|nr:outer membrane protein assembly factor BamA [Desulfobulbaceae bacterium]
MEVLHFRGLTMVSREETNKKFGSQASRPPSFKDLTSFAPAGKADYIATGSLTRYGSRISVDITLVDLLNEEAATFYFGEAQSAEELNSVLGKIVDKILAYTGRYFLITDIKISGNKKIDSGAILRQVKSRINGGYDRDQLRKDLKNIFKMGYFDDVQIIVDESEKGKQITFKVQERAVIGKIVISGNKEVDEEEVRDILTVSSGSIINNKQIGTSEQNISNLYRDKGFYNTTVKAELDYPTTESVDIRFNVEEGSKIYIKEINFVGNSHFKTKELKKIIETSKKGLLSWITDSGMLKEDALDRDAAR